MRLTRNTTTDGKCKYAIVRLDKIRERFGVSTEEIQTALRTLEREGVLEYGRPGTEEECFVLKLKDVFAAGALNAYANNVQPVDKEFAEDIRELHRRAENHPSRKKPD